MSRLSPPLEITKIANAAKIAKKAHAENLTLKTAAVQLGLVTADQFDQLVRPAEMTHP